MKEELYWTIIEALCYCLLEEKDNDIIEELLNAIYLARIEKKTPFRP